MTQKLLTTTCLVLFLLHTLHELRCFLNQHLVVIFTFFSICTFQKLLRDSYHHNHFCTKILEKQQKLNQSLGVYQSLGIPSSELQPTFNAISELSIICSKLTELIDSASSNNQSIDSFSISQHPLHLDPMKDSDRITSTSSSSRESMDCDINTTKTSNTAVTSSITVPAKLHCFICSKSIRLETHPLVDRHRGLRACS